MKSETWKPVIDYEGFYEVSDLGRIRALFEACRGRHKAGRILKLKRRPRKYTTVALFIPGSRPKYRSVHQIVLDAFVGPCPAGKETRHLDGVKTNLKLSNLKWGTPLENGQDRTRHGRIKMGDKAANSKLKFGDILKIRKLREAKVPYAKIANMFNICAMVAWRIANRKSWKHVPQPT